MMNKKLIGLMIVMIISVVTVSGCIGDDTEEPTVPEVPKTALSLEKTSDTIGEYQTSYTVKGKTEPNATVKMSSSKLNLDDIELYVQDDGSFEYQLNIPQDVDSVSVSFKASSEGNKSDSTESLSLSRNKTVENKPDTSSNEDTSTDSSSSSDSSSSDTSSSGGTFEQGFWDGAADAKAGRSPRFSGDPIMYDDPYQAGYADGYRNPHLV